MKPKIEYSFVAMEYWRLIFNRTYKVFITKNYICGAKVRGILPAARDRSGTVAIPGDLNDPETYVQAEKLAKYDKVNLTSRKFLRLDKANFQYARNEIEGIEFQAKRKWGMGSYPHSGILTLYLRNERKRRLILLGRQDGELVKQKLTAN